MKKMKLLEEESQRLPAIGMHIETTAAVVPPPSPTKAAFRIVDEPMVDREIDDLLEWADNLELDDEN